MMRARRPDGWLFSDLENALEHLVIVPVQNASTMAEPAFWDAATNKDWDAFEANNHPSYTRGTWLSLSWMSTYLASDRAVHQRAEAIADAQGELASLQGCRSQVIASLADKRLAARCVLRRWGVSTSNVDIVPFDTKKGVEIVTPL
jgi:hypothetical protein